MVTEIRTTEPSARADVPLEGGRACVRRLAFPTKTARVSFAAGTQRIKWFKAVMFFLSANFV